MKRFNVLFSFLLLAGLTCSDNLFASKKRKRTSFDVQQPDKEQKVSSDEKEKFSPSKPSNNIFSKIFNQQLTGKRPSINLDAKDEKGNTKLHNASLNGRVSEAELLIRAGAKFDFNNECGKTPLDLAIENKQIATKHLLQQYKALFEGAEDEDLQYVGAAIAAGAYVDAKDGAGYTPLHYAIKWTCEPAVRFFLKHGADANVRGNDGRTPLHEAALAGCLDIVQLLLDADAWIDAQDENGDTPLHWAASIAASLNEVEVVQLLLEHGANKSLVNKSQQTPLAAAKAGFGQSKLITRMIALLQVIALLKS